MHIRGIIQSAVLEENPPGSETIEMILSVQGVGPGQPRKIIIPYELLLRDPSLEPETIARHAFEADIDPAEGKRWLVSRIALAGRILRSPE